MKKWPVLALILILIFSLFPINQVADASKGNNGKGNNNVTEEKQNPGRGNNNNTVVVEEEPESQPVPVQEQVEEIVVVEEKPEEQAPVVEEDNNDYQEDVVPVEEGAYFSYVVKSGDTLFFIALAHDTTVAEIKAINGLTSDMILVGQVLLLPVKEVQVEESKEKSYMIFGYYTKYWATDRNSYQSLVDHHEYMNSIGTASLDVNADGTISGFLPTEGISFANNNGVAAYATIQNKFDPALASQILRNNELREKTIANMLTLVQDNQYAGININFENMYANDRVVFTQFMERVVDVFHAHSYPVMVSVPAKTCDCPTWAWSGTFDLKALGGLVDYVQVMSYDQHGSWGTAGPVVGHNWVKNVLDYTTANIPSEKLLIGLPAYGYDWNLTKGTGHKALTMKQIKQLIIDQNATVQWDQTSQSPYFYYVDSQGDRHVVWFENEASLAAKTKLVQEYNLAGVSMWRMGQEDKSFWTSIHSALFE
ncbi:glycosyl hydrolase family 18 protein [Bacillus alkalicellulosilyticus]|uniref:glycosyl hydrolase family 18 protein n=1 Tax=Alkalihalobacterium alkalicellulosilyticum TaxID=1912214 RepID=UPI00148324F2|nr:glycosyl hydrolase family 18 protein [Bacillus alkalicellulosilyticus]